jgi:hypothetical protein
LRLGLWGWGGGGGRWRDDEAFRPEGGGRKGGWWLGMWVGWLG